MDFRPEQIDDRVWFGRIPLAPEEWRQLKDLGVTDVISLITDQESLEIGLSPQVTFNLAVSNGIRLHRFGIEDASSEALIRWSPVVLTKITSLYEQGRSIYLHCRHGLYRSATVAAAWIAKRDGLDALEASRLLNELHGPRLPDQEALMKICGKV